MIKVQITDEFMAKEAFKENLKAILADFVKQVKKDEKEAAEKGLRMRKNPALSLYEEGKFTYDFIVSEFEPIVNKKSQLTSGKREVILQIVFAAARKTVEDEQAAEQIAKIEAEKEAE